LLISNYIINKPKDPFISFVIYPKKSRRFLVITTRYYLSLYLRTKLFRLIFAEILEGKRYLYPPGIIIIIVKPLYGIPKSSIYWFAIYNKYYIKELLITISPYDLCFLINTTKRPFIILVIQINNILFLVNK
jgi:hypothetical protein